MQVTWPAESETYTATVAAFSSHQVYPFKIIYDEFGDESWGAFSRDKFTTVDGCHAFEFVGQPPSPIASLLASPGQPAGSSPQPAPGAHVAEAVAPSQTVEGYQGPRSAPGKAVDCTTSTQTAGRFPQGPRPGSGGPQAPQTSTEAPKKRKRDDGDVLGSASSSQERPEAQAGSLKELLGKWPACTHLHCAPACFMQCMGFECTAAFRRCRLAALKTYPVSVHTCTCTRGPVIPLTECLGVVCTVVHRIHGWQLE